MPPVIQMYSPLQGASDTLTAYAEAERQNRQDALQAAADKSALATAAQQRVLTGQTIAANNATTAQTASNQKFEAGLKLPKGFEKMSPDKQVAYLQQRQLLAQTAHDGDLVSQTQDQINSIYLNAQRGANAQYTLEGRLPMAQAQTSNLKGLFDQQMRLLDRKGQLQMQAAYVAAKRHLGTGGRVSEADRENQAAAAAMNAMQRTEYGAQIRAAMDTFVQEQQDYRASVRPGYSGEPVTQPQLVIPQSPTTVYVSMPGQGVVPVQIPQPKTQLRRAAPRAAPRATPPPAGSDFSLINPGTWFNDWGHAGAGGNGQAAHAQRLQATSHGHPIYSDDGGKTWHS